MKGRNKREERKDKEEVVKIIWRFLKKALKYNNI